MNLISVDIGDFRGKLSDYLTLASLGKAVISVVNGKNGKEVARLVSPVVSAAVAEKRISELLPLSGFAAGAPTAGHKTFKRMELAYTRKLRKGKVE